MGVTYKMLIAEDRFAEIFAQLPAIKNASDVEFKPVFRYGDNLELLAFLKNSKGNPDRPYPLIWLLYPYEEEHTRTVLKLSDVVLILATETNAESNYQQRMEENYKKVLIPLYENIRLAFMRANIMSTNDVYDIVKYPNYGRPEEEASEAIDLWDAIKVTFDCHINSACLTNLKF
jgi:hypothetical protein